MTLTLDTRARVLLLVLFVLAASVASFMAYRGLHRSSDDSSTPAPLTAPAPKAHAPSAPAAAKPAAAARHGAPATHSKAASAAAPRAKAKPAAAPSPNQLPAAIRRALAADRVVVVALYDPNAKIDGAALAEARAGAKLGGVSFVPVDVRSRAVDSLNARYGAVQDPAVLVLRPPDSVVVRIDGFADRDTVAQAALNAAS